MSESKKYFYLKLKDNFFERDEMKMLKSMDNGYEYACILLEMYLKSLKNDGCLIFSEKIPFNAKMLSVVLGHNIAIVERALEVFQQLNLVETLNTGEIYMLDIQNFIGQSTTEADRVRNYRQCIAAKKSVSSIKESTEGVQMYDKCTPEIRDRDRDKELEIINTLSGKPDSPNPFSLIIDYLNQACGTKFRLVEANKKHINARLADGYSLDDFKTVIDKKAREWLGTENAKYLRPETLFGTKFDSYLNQIDVQKNAPSMSYTERVARGLEHDEGTDSPSVDDIFGGISK